MDIGHRAFRLAKTLKLLGTCSLMTVHKNMEVEWRRLIFKKLRKINLINWLTGMSIIKNIILLKINNVWRRQKGSTTEDSERKMKKKYWIHIFSTYVFKSFLELSFDENLASNQTLVLRKLELYANA